MFIYMLYVSVGLSLGYCKVRFGFGLFKYESLCVRLGLGLVCV